MLVDETADVGFGILRYGGNHCRFWRVPLRGRRAASEGSKRNEMKKLRIVLRYLAQPLAQRWRRRDKRPPKMYPVPAVDPEAFSSLLGSGRKEDMETLAKWLSRRRRSPA
jgi:hypothetical protein